MSYNPKPTRVWSRVQHPCTFTVDSSYNSIYSPLTGKTTTPIAADYYDKLLYKGNILQYKKNSSSLTKSQRYSQICKGMWTNRTKSYATQTQTYTNPNTSNLKQVNFINVPTNGNTNNIPGPFNFNIPAPYGCQSDSIKEGGSLLCNTVVNPCTDEVIDVTTVLECYPTYCSDVPGPIIDLCWNSKLDTWYPRQNLTMNNSTDKWPEGYKGFVSAVRPDAPYLIVDSTTCNSITLSWTIVNNDCIPISSYNIYQDNVLVQNVPYTITSTTISDLASCTSYSFYVTSISNITESIPSNTVFYGPNISTPSNISGIAGDTSCQISWSPPSITCIDSSIIRYDGQVNGFPMVTNITSPYIFTGLTNGTTYTFNIYTVAIINGVTSISCPATIILTPNFYYTSNIPGTAGTSGGYKYVYFINNTVTNISATIKFNLSNLYVSSVGVVCVGGGGGGGSGGSINGSHYSGRGGGGAGCGVIQLNPPTINLTYPFNVGLVGQGGPAVDNLTGNNGAAGGVSNLSSPSPSTVLISCQGGGGGSAGPGFVGSGGEQTVPLLANDGGDGGDTQNDGQNSVTIITSSNLLVPATLPLPFFVSYGGGGGGSDQAENGGSAGSYGNKGIAYGAADRNGGNATSSGSGGGGAGNNNASSGQESFTGGNGGPGLIGFWWQPLF